MPAYTLLYLPACPSPLCVCDELTLARDSNVLLLTGVSTRPRNVGREAHADRAEGDQVAEVQQQEAAMGRLET
jgi:hypothetical protein